MAEGDCLPPVHPLSIAASMATDQPYASSRKGEKISREVLERIRDGKEFEMKEQQNASLGILRGKQEVENTVQKRTCESLPGFPWFLVINFW